MDREREFDREQIRILERLAEGAPLVEVLERIVLLIERDSDGLGSILLLDPERRTIHHGAAPSLPPLYSQAVDGLAIGPDVGSCGAAAFRGESVIVRDIATHPNWTEGRDVALPHGLLACWSTPIKAPSGEVLGTFAVYYRTVRDPDPADLHRVEVATHLASLAIMKQRGEAALRRAEEQVRAAERQRARIYDSVADVLFHVGVEPDGRFRFLSVNRAFTDATGLATEQVVGHLVEEVIPEPSLSLVLDRYRTAIREQRAVRWDEVTTYPAGVKHGEVIVTPLFDDDGRCRGLVGAVHDITERKTLWAQVALAQRMESLGTLAGGIAHDFNNILTGIMGNVDLARTRLADPHPARDNLAIALSACERARQLVKRMLTFSRRHEPSRSRLKLEPVVDEAVRLLRSVLPAMIDLRPVWAADVPPVQADAAQVHQIVMNLGTNAAHAMRGGGTLTVRLEPVTLRQVLTTHTAELPAGRYARLSVEDTGSGMDDDTLRRAFDPFFTTKEPGEGTGLGLSVVHGIVEDHQGAIVVTTRRGVGTTFHLYFPADEGPVAESSAEPAEDRPPLGHGERVLYVDDEEPVLAVCRQILQTFGYRFTGFTDPSEALRAFGATPGDFDVVLTDFAMPRMSGIELAEAILRVRPELPVLLVSGWLPPAGEEAAQRLGIRAILEKPISLDAMVRALGRLFPAL